MIYTEKSYWLTREKWVCKSHLPTLKLNAHIEQCYLCDVKRPEFFKLKIDDGVIDFQEEAKKRTRNGKLLCDYVKCKRGQNKARAFAVYKSKYCCPECRKQKARDKYIAKKALENGNIKKNSKRNTG